MSDYHIPPLPTDVAARRFIGWLRRQFKKSEETQPFIAESDLVQASGETLEDVAPPPGCVPMLRDLDDHFATFVRGEVNSPQLHLLLPPGDRNNVLNGWAKEARLDVLQPPKRQQLLNGNSPLNVQQREFCLQEQWSEEHPTNQPVLVIPRLEDWFLRHENGLGCIRQLLDRLEQSKRRMVIGCNTWAWDFLCKATQAELLLPSPLTFQSFGADELRAWFHSLEEDAPMIGNFACLDVALTSAYLEYAKPVVVMLTQTPYGTHYKLKAYPFEMRDQFAFISDMVVRGKRAIARAGGTETTADFVSSQSLG